MDIKVEPLMESELRPVPAGDFGFGRTFSNRMFSQVYTPEKGWHDAKIGPYGPISLEPATSVFHYAQEIFEGTKAYRLQNGNINLFRPWENMKRFNASARRMAAQTAFRSRSLCSMCPRPCRCARLSLTSWKRARPAPVNPVAPQLHASP